MDLTEKLLSGGYSGRPVYQRPLLASLYYTVGGIFFVGTAIAATLPFIAPNITAGQSAAASILTCIGGLLFALVAFGTGQVVDHIGRIAYNTEAERNDDIVDKLGRIEAHLAAMRTDKPAGGDIDSRL